MSSNHRLGYRRALLNNKGGVGKTMFAVELAAALARRGRKVLAVDMDPQANLTRRLATRDSIGVNLTEVLRGPGNGEAARCVRLCGWEIGYAEQIHILPSSLSLEDRVLEAGMPGAARRLRKALYGVSDSYDWTLIDCPPSMGPLTQMALSALDSDADAVLLPVVPEHDAIAGAERAIALMDMWAEDLIGHDFHIAGVLVNGVRAQTSLHQVRLGDLPQKFVRSRGSRDHGVPVMVPVWDPAIPLLARIAELHDAGQPAASDRQLVTSGVVERFDRLAQQLDHPVADDRLTAGGTLPAMATAFPGGATA